MEPDNEMVTEGERTDAVRQDRLWFLESMEQISRAIQGTEDLEQLAVLLRTTEHDSITRNVLNFLRATEYCPPPIQEVLVDLALDNTRTAQLRIDALERIGTTHAATETVARLANDQELSVREYAFRALVRLQDRATVTRALAIVTDADLQAGEVPFPNASPLDWIGTIATPLVIDELRALRQRTAK